LEAQVPYSFYTVHSNNQLFLAQYYSGAIQNMRTLTIPSGNYNPTTICAVLTATYPVVATTGSADTNYAFTTATYSDTTGKLTLTPNSATFNTSYPVYIIVNPAGTYAPLWQAAVQAAGKAPANFKYACVEPLGLSDIAKLQDVALTANTATQLPNTISLGGPAYVAIRGNFGVGGNTNVVTCGDGTDVNGYNGNILAFVPINTIPGGTITWKNMAPRGGFFAYPISTLESAQLW
jgi:hypothetical protein